MAYKNGQQSRLGALSDHQRAELISWMVDDRLTYVEAKKRVKQLFGVQTSETALHNFWNRECGPYLLRRQALQNAFLEIKVRVRQGEKILGQTEFAVSLVTPARADQAVAFEASAKSKGDGA